ncbi:MAG: D-alanyl-D-alanine carboxypeptidase/D-alanyl-D-alanine-endopeptidase, partial [Myxococcales bacterium]|nr:D-alanyl-D-alanine carboxypeptidase/D-alanyl-D-alanine-endopeptidase [Myxococcales bacterium]
MTARLAWLAALGAAVALSMGSRPARSQGTAGPTEDDDGSAAGSGGGSALIAPPVPGAKKPWLVEQLTRVLQGRPVLSRARIAVAVTDLSTGEELFAANADQKLNLASNTKLLTSAAALQTLGNSFRWRTTVLADTLPDDAGTIAGDLYLRGKGDPMLTVAHLEELATEVAARGVRTIEGKLVLDTGYFDEVVEPPHFSAQPTERAGFRAPVASLGVARSSFQIQVIAEPGGGASVRLDPDTGGYYTLTKREVTSVTEGRTRLRVETKLKQGKVEVEVTGTIRVGEGSWEIRRRVDDPARFAGEIFRRALADRGVTIRQRVLGSAAVPVTAKPIAVHDSPPLPDVLRFMNKSSDNYVAESVLKTLGAETRATPGPASWADGLEAMASSLAQLGLQRGSYRAENGSGLFAASEVTAHQLITLLAAAHKDYRIGPDLLASLPIGGVDGTLARRWHGHAAKGRVRAKTGTLDRVVTLAGYVAADSGRPLAFTILLNDVPPNQRAAARAL